MWGRSAGSEDLPRGETCVLRSRPAGLSPFLAEGSILVSHLVSWRLGFLLCEWMLKQTCTCCKVFQGLREVEWFIQTVKLCPVLSVALHGGCEMTSRLAKNWPIEVPWLSLSFPSWGVETRADMMNFLPTDLLPAVPSALTCTLAAA